MQVVSYAINFFLVRMKVENNLNVPNIEKITDFYNEIYSDEKLANFIYKYFGNEKVLKAFPNLKVQDVDGNIIYMDSLLPDIQPYYLKIHDKNPHVK